MSQHNCTAWLHCLLWSRSREEWNKFLTNNQETRNREQWEGIVQTDPFALETLEILKNVGHGVSLESIYKNGLNFLQVVECFTVQTSPWLSVTRRERRIREKAMVLNPRQLTPLYENYPSKAFRGPMIPGLVTWQMQSRYTHPFS